MNAQHFSLSQLVKKLGLSADDGEKTVFAHENYVLVRIAILHLFEMLLHPFSFVQATGEEKGLFHPGWRLLRTSLSRSRAPGGSRSDWSVF